MNANRFFMASPDSDIEIVTQGSGYLQLAAVPVDRVENVLTDSCSQFDRLLENQQVISSDDIDNTRAFQTWFERWSRDVTGQDNTPFVDSEFALGEILSSGLHTLMETEIDSDQATTKFSHAKLGVRRLIDYFHASPGKSISIENMIDISGLGRRNLFYHFKNYTGYPPQHYLNRIKLSFCRTQILGCQRSVTSIALDHHFGHLGEFSAFYKSIYGELPSESRIKANCDRFENLD